MDDLDIDRVIESGKTGNKKLNYAKNNIKTIYHQLLKYTFG